uniref:Uncharacterized protein n=1 Tax=Anguilla anguilla TaxID=7936 RepID=A0A0E9TNQ8_ANGAN
MHYDPDRMNGLFSLLGIPVFLSPSTNLPPKLSARNINPHVRS